MLLATEAEMEEEREDCAEAGAVVRVVRLCWMDVSGTMYVAPPTTTVEGQVRVAMSERIVVG